MLVEQVNNLDHTFEINFSDQEEQAEPSASQGDEMQLRRAVRAINEQLSIPPAASRNVKQNPLRTAGRQKVPTTFSSINPFDQ